MALADATQQFSAGGKPIGTPPAVDEGSSRSTFSPAVGVVFPLLSFWKVTWHVGLRHCADVGASLTRHMGGCLFSRTWVEWMCEMEMVWELGLACEKQSACVWDAK